MSLRYKLILFVAVLLLVYRQSNGQTAEVGPTFKDTVLCVESALVVPITVTSGPTYDSTIYEVQLSNATGSFSSPTTIGYSYAISPVPANCQLPASVPAGTGYRIRIVLKYPSAIVSISPAFAKPIRISVPPTISANATNKSLCLGEQLNLQGTSSYSNSAYTWTGPAGVVGTLQNQIKTNISFADSGYYKLKVEALGCTVYDSVKILVNPAPSNLTRLGDSSVCEDGDFNIAVNCNVCTLANGVVNFLWQLNGNVLSYNSSVIVKNIPKSYAGWYKVTVRIGNCSATDSFRAYVKPLPDTPKVTSNSPLCAGETLQLNGNSGTGGSTYRWEGPGGFSATGSAASRPDIQKPDEGKYYLYATKDGCDSKPGVADVKVGIPLVALQVSGDTALCPGGKLQLSAQTSITGGIEWKKMPDTINAVAINRTLSKSPVVASDAGIYFVTQEVNGCKSPPTYINVTIPDVRPPLPKSNSPLCIGDQLKLTAEETPGGTYSWTGPGGFTSNAQNPVRDGVIPAWAGKYTVTSLLEYCSQEGSVDVAIKPKPVITSITSNTPVCTNTNLNLAAECDLANASFAWTGPDGFTSDKQNPVLYYMDSNSGTYKVKAIVNGCASDERTTNVESKEGPGLTTARNNSPMDEGQRLELYAKNDKPGIRFLWTGPDGFTSEEQNPVIEVSTFKNSGKYEVLTIYNECTTSAFTIVEVKDILGITITLYPNPNDGKFAVKGIAQKETIIKLRIYSHLGLEIYNGETPTKGQKFEKEIDLRGAPSGVYLMQVFAGGEKRTIRFTIVKQR